MTNPILTIMLAVSQALSLPFLIDLAKTGIKADEKVPNTKTSKTKSGNRNAAKNKLSSLGSKKCANVLCLTNPSTLEATIITIIIVAADNTLDCGEVNILLPLLMILFTM
jgi:hypothetical protein